MHDLTRILFFGDMAPTGFGTVTMDLGRALLDKGQDVRFVSQNAPEDKEGELPEPFASRTTDTASLLSVSMGPMGVADQTKMAVRMQQFVPDLLRGQTDDIYTVSGVAWGEWRPEMVVILGDFNAVRMYVSPFSDFFRTVPSYHYVPIEGIDLPPLWREFWDVVKPVAVTEFGADEIEKVMGYRPPVAYHGVDSDTFRPATPARPFLVKEKESDKLHRITSKESAKAFFGIHPRIRVCLRTDANWPRKNYPSLIRAMVPVLASHPDTILAIHARAHGPGGFLPDTLSKFVPEHIPAEQVQLTGLGYVSREVLATLYNAADVYVSSSAEGFGLTIAESIACGVPAVGLRYSAVPEVLGPAGITVPVGALTDNEYDHFWARPDEPEFTKAVSWLLDHPKRARELGALGPKHVRDTFTWDRAADVFLGLT